MKRTKKLLSVILTACLVISLLPSMSITVFSAIRDEFTDAEGIFRYKVIEEPTADTNGRLAISAENRELSTYTIPTEVEYNNETYDVTQIEWEAFLDCENLTAIVIPEGITVIEYSAFKNCTALESVVLPSTLTSIKGSAFENCTSLTSIDLPNGITSMEHAVFAGSGLTSLTFPAGITEIKNSFFKGCTSLESIVIPDTITILGSSVFEGCTSLSSVTLSNNLTRLNTTLFKGCTSLTSIDIPSGITAIESSVFEGTGFTSFTVPTNITVISYKLFKDCESLEEVIFHDRVTGISSNAFENCTSLTSVDLPESVSTIEGSAFKGSGLTSFTVPENVTVIEVDTFENCTALEDIYIHDAVTAILGSAFSGCTSLTNLYIPDSVDTIWNLAFSGCTSLGNVYIANDGEDIFDEWTFADSNAIVYQGTKIMVYGTNTVSYNEEIYVDSGYTLIFDDDANLTIDGNMYLPEGTDVPTLLSEIKTNQNVTVDGEGLILIFDSEGNVIQAYDTAGNLLNLYDGVYTGEWSNMLDFTSEPYPVDDDCFTYNPATKTLTLEDGAVLDGTVMLPDGATVVTNGKAWILWEITGEFESEEPRRFTFSGTGTLYADVSDWLATVIISQGTKIKTTMMNVYGLTVAGKLYAYGEEGAAIYVRGEDGRGGLTRTGTGANGGYIYAEALHGHAFEGEIYNGASLDDETIISTYIRLNDGTETHGYVPGVFRIEEYDDAIISYFDEEDELLQNPQKIIEIVPPEEEYVPPSSGGGGLTPTYSVVYHPCYEGEDNVTKKYVKNAEVTVADGTLFEAPEGMKFVGWAKEEGGETVYNGGEKFDMPDKTVNLYALWTEDAPIPQLNREDHILYIVGYPDGTVRPMRNITREETAMIFYRLLDSETREYYRTREHPFTDVDAGHEGEEAIATLYNAGILFGRSETVFDPNAPITRGEYAAISARFDSEAYEKAEDMFDDIATHWARDEINRAATRGWIVGDGGRLFRPLDCITRAEAITLINKVLVRNPETTADLLDGMKTFSDNLNPDVWYYIEIQEASNAHTYERKENGTEKWVSVN